MMLAAREIRLGPGRRRFDVRYVPEVVDEIADRDDAEALMDELESVLGHDPVRPPGRRAKSLQGTDGLRRYRPRIDNDLRVFYAIEDDQVWILALHPRKTAYRPQNLQAAAKRLRRSVE